MTHITIHNMLQNVKKVIEEIDCGTLTIVKYTQENKAVYFVE
jgi:hypothetical protein